jgi:hypothetical protein
MSSKDKVRLFSELSPAEQLQILRGPKTDKAQFEKQLKEESRWWRRRLAQIRKSLLEK